MSRLLNRFRDNIEDAFTEDEVAAAELIVESVGKKVVKASAPAVEDGQCFICHQSGLEGTYENFMTINGHYKLFVCNECAEQFKA